MSAREKNGAIGFVTCGALVLWIGCNGLAGIEDATLIKGSTVNNGDGPGSSSGASGSSSSGTTGSSSGPGASTSSGASSSSSSSSGTGPVGSCNGLAAYSVNDPGVTSPTVHDSALNGPLSVASDGTRIVYTISGQTTQQICGSVKSWDAANGARLISNFEQYPTTVSLNGNFAYYTMEISGGFYAAGKRALVSGTSGSTVISSRVFPTTMRLQSNIAYIGDKTGIYGCDFNVNSSGCSDAPDTVVSRSAQTRGMVVSATRIAWLEAGSVYACNRTSCSTSVVTLASGLTSARDMQLDGSTVYFSEDGSGDNRGNVWSTSIDAPGTVTPILCGLNHPQSLTVDGASVYVSNRGTPPDFVDGTVVKCAKGGCSNRPTVMAKNQTQPYGITVDSARLYWTTKGVDVGAGQSCNAASATGAVASVPK